MLINNWKQRIFRNAEGEGGGGAGASGEGALNAAPASDRNSALERRVADLQGQLERDRIERQTRDQQSEQSRLMSQVQAAETRAAGDVDAAEQALATAYEDGDGVAIAKAQRRLSEAAAKKERIATQAAQFREEIKRSERRQPQHQSQVDTTNLQDWQNRNKEWYGVDVDMTRAAKEADALIREAGVLAVGSKEYFDAVDRKMRQQFPDRFKGSPPSGSTSGSGAAPTGHTSGQQRIPASVAEGYRRMGINVDDPAVAKRMITRREEAVKAGFLPETPASGRIINRG